MKSPVRLACREQNTGTPKSMHAPISSNSAVKNAGNVITVGTACFDAAVRVPLSKNELPLLGPARVVTVPAGRVLAALASGRAVPRVFVVFAYGIHTRDEGEEGAATGCGVTSAWTGEAVMS